MQIIGSQTEQNLVNTQTRMTAEDKKSANIAISESKAPVQQDTFGETEQEKQLIKLIEDSNKTIRNNQNEFQFSVHEKTKQIVIKVVDKQTKEVVKELPPEKILDMISKMCEIAGVFVDERG